MLVTEQCPRTNAGKAVGGGRREERGVTGADWLLLPELLLLLQLLLATTTATPATATATPTPGSMAISRPD